MTRDDERGSGDDPRHFRDLDRCLLEPNRGPTVVASETSVIPFTRWERARIRLRRLRERNPPMRVLLWATVTLALGTPVAVVSAARFVTADPQVAEDPPAVSVSREPGAPGKRPRHRATSSPPATKPAPSAEAKLRPGVTEPATSRSAVPPDTPASAEPTPDISPPPDRSGLTADLPVRVRAQVRVGQQLVLAYATDDPDGTATGAFVCRPAETGTYTCLVTVDRLVPGDRYRLTARVVDQPSPSGELPLATDLAALIAGAESVSKPILVTRAP